MQSTKRLYGDIEERVLARGKFSDLCWEWTGYLNADGYGRVRIGGKYKFVHRAVIEWTLSRRLSRNEITDHLCRNPSCFRPSHLDVVSPSENTRRGLAARLSSAEARALIQARKTGATYTSLAKLFGIHYTTAIRIFQNAQRHLRIDVKLHVQHRKENARLRREALGQQALGLEHRP